MDSPRSLSGVQLTRSEAGRRLNPHLLTLVPLRPSYDVQYRPATSLLSANRMDVVAKYIYARSVVTGYARTWGEYVYREHLRAFNPSFVEGDGSGKQSYADYRDSFLRLIESMAQGGFDDAQSVVPLSSRGTLTDGAHRTAAAMALNLQLPTIRVDYHDHDLSAAALERGGLQVPILDALVMEFCLLCVNPFVAVLFPCIQPHRDTSLRILCEYADIVYRRQMRLSENGYQNLFRLIYRDETWLGHSSKASVGIGTHLAARCRGDDAVEFVVLCPRDSDAEAARAAMRMAKERVRDVCRNGNYPIHINDTADEAIWVARHVFGPNAPHYLNHAHHVEDQSFSRMQRGFRQWILNTGGRIEDYCIDSGGTMAAYGLRGIGDLDVLAMKNDPWPDLPGISNQSDQLCYHDFPLDELIHDPRRSFYHNGLKFISPRTLKAMKANRVRPKDIADIALLDGLSDNRPSSDPRVGAVKPPVGLVGRIVDVARVTVKKILPVRYHVPVYRLLQGAKLLPSRVVDWVWRRDRTRIYYGFVLHHRTGAPQVRQIADGSVYEPAMTRCARQLLRDRQHPCLLDIGSDLGLVTLNALHTIDDLVVHLFRDQPDLIHHLRQTIRLNMLESSITLHD